MKASIVMNIMSGSPSCIFTSGTLSKSHLILLAEKYGEYKSPVLSLTSFSLFTSFSLSMHSDPLRSCHTIAL